MNKKELRQKMKALRAELPADYREESAARVARLLQELPAFQAAETLFCYASVGAELSTQYIAQAHPRVAYPKVFPDGSMRFYLGGELKAGFRGIPEPVGGEEVNPKPTDLMLLPGLAFGLKNGARLGYGGGYYDRYLASLKERPICCGIGYEEQILFDPIPVEPHDRAMDLLVAPRWVTELNNEKKSPSD